VFCSVGRRIGAEARATAALPTQAGQTTTRWTLRLVAVGYVAVLVLLPLGVMILRTFEDGLAAFVDSVTSPEALAAIGLSLRVAALAVLINTVFGLTSALLLTRYRFPGRSVLNALIDLPVSVSPVVAGLALILVYGRNGWFGGSLQEAGIQVIYAEPAIVLATCFVSLPLVVRELIPVLEEIGLEQEQAGRSLGANAWQRLWRLTLPSVRWALAYGVVLTLARSLGEFGAVRVVAGNVLGSTQTMPLLAAQRYNDLDEQGAYAVSFVMVAVAILCIVVVAILRPKQRI
jgi:sulfate/thiosulfate transport system permease protein